MPVVGAHKKRHGGHGLHWTVAVVTILAVTLAGVMASASSSDAEPASLPLLTFEYVPNTEDGLLDPARPFDCMVRLTGLQPKPPEELVAIFESLAYPHRLVAFTPEDGSRDLIASVRFEPRGTAGADGQPLRMEIVVARLKGMRLETVFSRPVYLTTVPVPAQSAEAASASLPGTPLLEAIVKDAPATDREGRPVHPLVPEENIVVEELNGTSTDVSGPLYWKQLSESVARLWQQRRAQLRKEQAGRGLRVRFRLYRRGFAQQIQIERSSGDPNVDEAGLRTVLALHPFPPLPSEIHEPSVDVHVHLPGVKR